MRTTVPSGCFPVLMLAALLVTPTSLAQKAATKAAGSLRYSLVAVNVTGTSRYSDKDILAATGLALGQKAGDEDFKGAVHVLGDTGMFSGVAYSYSFSPAGTKVEFQLTDLADAKLVPAHFENFVWFRDADLIREIQRRVPLFQSRLPVTGSMIDRVSEALQTILDEKRIPGRVDYLREGQPDGGDLTGVAYKVLDLPIRIRNTQFPGATAEQTAALTKAARGLKGAEYLRSAMETVAQMDLLPVYLERGYLRAAFATPEAVVGAREAAGDTSAADSTDASEVKVDAVFPVTPGKQYSTADVVWKGTSAVPLEQLQQLVHMPVGAPANATRLKSDLENATKLYRNRGYMEAQIVPDAVIDEGNGTVRYGLNILQGEQYKMGELELLGLDSQETSRLQAAWGLREGDPYNGDYPKKFLDEAQRLLAKGTRWAATVRETTNARDKTVDVTIRYTAN